MKSELLTPFTIKAAPKFYAALDDWRRKQTPIPSRSEAIRVLVSEAIAISGKKREK